MQTILEIRRLLLGQWFHHGTPDLIRYIFTSTTLSTNGVVVDYSLISTLRGVHIVSANGTVLIYSISALRMIWVREAIYLVLKRT